MYQTTGKPLGLATVALLAGLLIHLLLPSYCIPISVQGANQPQARLIKRYEQGNSLSGVGEDILEIRLEPDPRKRELVAIRICSKEALAFASFKAAIDPFKTAGF